MHSPSPIGSECCNTSQPVTRAAPPWCIFHSLSRHWQRLSEELGVTVLPKPTLTFSKCLEMGLQDHIKTISEVAEIAGKEFSIEQVCTTHTPVITLQICSTYPCKSDL